MCQRTAGFTSWILEYAEDVYKRQVSDRYKVVQNENAFAFTDELLGEGDVYKRQQ